MRNPTGKKLEKIIFKIFDDAIQGVDRYNHNDSLWLIFTNEMKWVVEFTKDQTLWYNYNFFKDEMELIGLDCVEDKDLIQKWFESRFLNINSVEDTIQNGVKHTHSNPIPLTFSVEDTIQNGVKHTEEGLRPDDSDVEDTIQNGVKHTNGYRREWMYSVEDTIQNGVKHTQQYRTRCMMRVEDTIQKGVKQTELSKRDFFPKDTIQNGVKETISTLRRTAKWGVDDIIQNGIKDTKSMCGKRGGRVGNTIQNGVKETHDDCSNNIARVEGIVRIGEKLN